MAWKIHLDIKITENRPVNKNGSSNSSNILHTNITGIFCPFVDDLAVIIESKE